MTGPGEDPHRAANLQTLCLRHHKRKTKADKALLAGKARHPAILLAPAALGLVWLAFAHFGRGTLAALAFLLIVSLGVGLRVQNQRKTLRRLHTSTAQVTGLPTTARLGKHWKPRVWERRKVEGRRLKVPVPTAYRHNYPDAFDDGNPSSRADFERRTEAKLGGTWRYSWHTQANFVEASSPDPLASPVPIRMPLPIGPTSLWEPIPVALDEDGHDVEILLPERNLLIGGEPGAGKTVTLARLAAWAALDPGAALYLLDGKNLELSFLADSAMACVGDSIAEATLILKDLQAAIAMRYELLRDDRRRKITPGDGHDFHVLVIDELAYYTTALKRDARDEFITRLRDVVSRGRAAGVICLLATQRPSADVIPTSIRDLVGFRWAMRCTTPASSDMVLGQGWASAGYSAGRIEGAQRGLGLLLAEGSNPVRCKAPLVDDSELFAMADRALALRQKVR